MEPVADRSSCRRFSLNRCLRDPGRLSIAGQMPRSSCPAGMLGRTCGSPADPAVREVSSRKMKTGRAGKAPAR